MPNYKKSNNTAPLEKETLVVEFAANGQYGPYVKANGEFYGLNEPLTEADFQKGQAYMVLVKRGAPSEKNPKGKGYITQIVGGTAAMDAQAKAAISPDEKQAAAKSAVAAKEEYAEKQKREARGKTRCVQFEAAVASPWLATQSFENVQEYIKAATAIADAGVAYTFEEAI